MTRLVISQPMLMPWRGMFEQIALCDSFVFYDDVQLPLGGGKGRGFITRVQIKGERGIEWLSLPVARAGKGEQLICDARFAHMDWKAGHLAAIERAYRRAPHFRSVMEGVVRPIYALDSASVAQFCMHSMNLICEAIGLRRPTAVASALDIPRSMPASARVLAFCRAFGADEYISGLGAINYIDYALFEEAGVRIHYMDYALSPYPQMHGEFTPYVSFIDLMFNLGISAAAAALEPRSLYWKDHPRAAESARGRA